MLLPIINTDEKRRSVEALGAEVGKLLLRLLSGDFCSPNWNEPCQEVRMNSPIRWSTASAAFASAIVLVAAASYLASAHDGPHPMPDVGATTVSEVATEDAFLAENDAAMKKMMNDMLVKPTGDVDADFVALMVPHHQGAIDMALAVLRHGRNAQIRRLAQEIIVTQQQEIVAMRLAVREAPPPSVASPTEPSRRPAVEPPNAR
jgi:hypothetical protein